VTDPTDTPLPYSQADRSWMNRNCDPDVCREAAAVMGEYNALMQEPVVGERIDESLSPFDVTMLAHLSDKIAHQQAASQARMDGAER